jgi:hypothetical protein
MSIPRFPLIVVTFLLCVPCVGEPPDFTKGPEALVTQTPSLEGASWLRLQVELRRAGGPRPQLVEQIFKESNWPNSGLWSYALYDACRRRLVDCNHFLADPRAGQARGVREQAVLQALGAGARKELYRKALERGVDAQDPSHVDGGEAARYAIAEGMDDLLPDVKRWVRSHSADDFSKTLRAWVAVDEASKSSDPAVAVVRIIERACRDEVDDLRKNDAGHRRPKELEDEISGALEAFDGLRRLNSPDVLPNLKALYRGYMHVAENYERRAQELHAPPPRATLGDPCRLFRRTLEFELAQLIGDLGDRTFERRIAYQKWSMCGARSQVPRTPDWPIPWDRLYVIERARVQKGEMTQSDMVTR